MCSQVPLCIVIYSLSPLLVSKFLDFVFHLCSQHQVLCVFYGLVINGCSINVCCLSEWSLLSVFRTDHQMQTSGHWKKSKLWYLSHSSAGMAWWGCFGGCGGSLREKYRSLLERWFHGGLCNSYQDLEIKCPLCPDGPCQLLIGFGEGTVRE